MQTTVTNLGPTWPTKNSQRITKNPHIFMPYDGCEVFYKRWVIGIVVLSCYILVATRPLCSVHKFHLAVTVCTRLQLCLELTRRLVKAGILSWNPTSSRRGGRYTATTHGAYYQFIHHIGALLLFQCGWTRSESLVFNVRSCFSAISVKLACRCIHTKVLGFRQLKSARDMRVILL